MRTLSQRAGLAIRQAVKMISMAGKELVPFFSCRGMRALSGSLARKTPMCEDLWCNIATVLYFIRDTYSGFGKINLYNFFDQTWPRSSVRPHFSGLGNTVNVAQISAGQHPG